MNTIQIHYDIKRSPDDVFALLTDFSQLRQWRSLDDIRLDPEGPARVGTRLFTKVTGIRRPMEFTNEIMELDPARHIFRDRCLGGTFLIQSSWQVEPNNGGSRLRWLTEFEAPGLMVLLTPLLRRAIRQGQLQDLAKLKQLLEKKDNRQESELHGASDISR